MILFLQHLGIATDYFSRQLQYESIRVDGRRVDNVHVKSTRPSTLVLTVFQGGVGVDGVDRGLECQSMRLTANVTRMSLRQFVARRRCIALISRLSPRLTQRRRSFMAVSHLTLAIMA